VDTESTSYTICEFVSKENAESYLGLETFKEATRDKYYSTGENYEVSYGCPTALLHLH
jgi:hypothetical protein